MNPHYIYLLIDVATIFFPLVLSFDKKVAFYRRWKSMLLPMLLTGAVFIAWDVLFTAQGVWWFNREFTLPIRLLGLPPEEWMFFLVVPYACVFVAACLDAYFPPESSEDKGWPWLIGLGILLIVIASLNYFRAYTASACGACGAGLLAAYLLRRFNPGFRADRFLLAYGVCLVPFLLVNGLLTSLPVVLYDDSENTGIRIYSIPAEDVFYGMLLVLGNIWGSVLAGVRGVRVPD